MDWESFFTDNNVDYITRGQNVKKGNINICCPWCGDDPSFHMGVSLHEKGYGCWRSVSHAGKAPHRLVRALLNCSYETAKLIVKQYSVADPQNLDEALNALEAGNTPRQKPAHKPKLIMPSEFRDIKSTGTTARFYEYLAGRGFNNVDELTMLYNLRSCSTGKFKDRIIIPIYRKGNLVSWTSRALGKVTDAPRYLALSEDEGGLVNVFHTLWNWDELMYGGEVLIVVEGPFDALKLDYYISTYNCCATCTFGTSMSEEQALLIMEASRRFKRSILLYDEGATEAIFLAKEKLVRSKVEIEFLPEGVEDPGDMTRKQVRTFIKSLL